MSAVLSIVALGAIAGMYRYGRRVRPARPAPAPRTTEPLAQAYRDALSALTELSSVVLEVQYQLAVSQPLSEDLRVNLSQRSNAINRVLNTCGFMFPQRVIDVLEPVNNGEGRGGDWSRYSDAISKAHHVITYEARRSFVP